MNIFEIVGMLVLVGLIIFVSKINLIDEPKCEEKGYSNASSMGCYKYENGEIFYEDWIKR